MRYFARAYRAAWIALFAIMMLPVLAACGSDEAAPATVAHETTAPNTSAAALRPTAPAPIDSDFRDDPAGLVGATGNPQLLEFYTTW